MKILLLVTATSSRHCVGYICCFCVNNRLHIGPCNMQHTRRKHFIDSFIH